MKIDCNFFNAEIIIKNYEVLVCSFFLCAKESTWMKRAIFDLFQPCQKKQQFSGFYSPKPGKWRKTGFKKWLKCLIVKAFDGRVVFWG